MPSSVSQAVLDVAAPPVPRKTPASQPDIAFSDLLARTANEPVDEPPRPQKKAPPERAHRSSKAEQRQDEAPPAKDDAAPPDEPAKASDGSESTPDQDQGPTDETATEPAGDNGSDATQAALALAMVATPHAAPNQPAATPETTAASVDAIGDAAKATAVALPLAAESDAEILAVTEAETAETDPSGAIVAPKLAPPGTTQDKPQTRSTVRPTADEQPAPLRAAEPVKANAKAEAKPAEATPPPIDPAAQEAPKPEAPKAEMPRPEAVRADPAIPVPVAATADTSRLVGPSLAQTTAQTQSPAVTIPQVAATIVAHAKGGESRFQIRLDPADLGRIDVSMSVDQSGTTSTVLTVERMDTLDLLQRDSRALERALNTAGFKTDQGSLQFTYRDPGQQSSSGQQQNFGEGRGRHLTVIQPDRGIDAALPPHQNFAAYGPGRFRLGGLDIKV